MGPFSLNGQIYDTVLINHFRRRRFKYIFISGPNVRTRRRPEAKFITNLRINLPTLGGAFLISSVFLTM